MLFRRYGKNPIILPDATKGYESKHTYNPAAIVHDNKIYLIYRAEGESSSLCLAVSEDGFNFKKHDDNPIIKPTIAEEKGGCEDPRITKIGDTFHLLYTSYNGQQPVTSETINESYATSLDGIHWEKKGILVRGLKSAALFPSKIQGKYFMFIGGENIKVAESVNLVDWDIDETAVLDTRENKFDNRYVEVGPPPFIYKDKIVFFFNTADKEGTFYTSLALFDKDNPRKLVYRAEKPLMIPTEKYEREGYVKNVIFGSGLVEFKGTYFYYYGAADTTVCVATISKIELEKYLSSLELDLDDSVDSADPVGSPAPSEH